MKRLPRLFRWLGLFAGFAAPLIAAKDQGLDILISADAIPSPEGFRPKPGKPIHYLFTQNRATLGDTVAGVKLPAPALVESVIVATLGDSNFEPPNLPPNVNPLFEPDFGPYLEQVNLRKILNENFPSMKVPESIAGLFPPDAQDPRLGFPSSDSDVEQARELALAEAIRIRERGSARGQDRGKILSIVGAIKVDQAVSEGAMSSAAAQRIVWATRENLLYVTLNAFDAMRWKAKERVLLW